MMLAKTFKSKVNLALASPILALLFLVTLLMIGNQYWLNAFLVAGAGFAFATLICDTSYRLSNQVLEIKRSVLFKKKIKVNTITKIIVTSAPFATSAHSQDQLCIYFNQSEFIIISPKEKADFIIALRTLNPNIEVA